MGTKVRRTRRKWPWGLVEKVIKTRPRSWKLRYGWASEKSTGNVSELFPFNTATLLYVKYVQYAKARITIFSLL